jgi:DNA-binding GntR family transcriptional regulator
VPGVSVSGRRRDRVSEVYERVRDLIVRGRVAPGVRLIEAQIVERLSVSRTSVRSALQRLQQEGYVSGASPGRRARPTVTPLTSDDARELFSMVAEIEGLAAERSADLPQPARRSLVQRLTEVNEEYRVQAMTPFPDGDRLFALDTRFHREYVDAGAGPRLLALHDAIKPQLERYVRVYQTALHDAIITSVVEHSAIVAEIATGSGRGAQEAVRTNWRNAAIRLQAVIGSRGEAGNW